MNASVCPPWSWPLAAASLLVMSSNPAHAQSIIKRPGFHPRYCVEAEPHLVLAFDDPLAVDVPGDWGYGLGARLSIPIAPEGLIAKINDSAAVGFGVDFLWYTDGAYEGLCTRRVSAPAGTTVCVETTSAGGSSDVLTVPVVFQWNFWLTPEFSVFGEPGLAFVHGSIEGLELAPLVMWAGGRYQFNDAIALTARVGFPSISLGVSFLP